MKGRVAAHLMLSIALAAAVFCCMLMQGVAGANISGASSQRRYFSLGIKMTRGINYAVSDELVAQLSQRLSRSFVIATGFTDPPEYSSLALPDGSKRIDIAVNHVSARYFQAIDLPNVLGQVISPDEGHASAPAIVINRRCANMLFGSAKAAINRVLVLRTTSSSYAEQLHVVGVVTNAFSGIRAADDSLFHRKPLAWVATRPSIYLPALLSVPANLSDAEIRHDLSLAWSDLPVTVKGRGSHGLAFTQPFSFEPHEVAATTYKLKLYSGLSVAALLLTVINLVAVNFLDALRRRSVHAIERTLGARRAWQMQRVLYRALLGALVTLVATGALLVAALVVTRRAIAAIHRQDSPWWRIGRVLHLPHLLVPAFVLVLVVAVIEVLVHRVLLVRELRESSSMQFTGSHGERQVGSVILALEFTLGTLLTVLAFWGTQYAWQISHENLGMLQGQRLTLLTMGVNMGAPSDARSNGILMADLRRAITGIDPHAEVAFGPVISFPYRHGAGNFRSNGMGKLEAGHAGIITQGFVASATWLSVSETQLLAGRNFNSDNPDPREILIDAAVARTLFGSVRGAVGQEVHLEPFAPIESATLRVHGVMAPLRLNGPGRAPVASFIGPMRGGGQYFMDGRNGNILIRPAVPAARYQALQSAVERVFAKDASYLKVTSIQSSAQLLDRLDRPQRILATVFGAVAGFGLLIALTGLFVFLRLFLAMRKRVDAIRQALGASPRRLYTGIVGGAVILGLAGALLALLLTPWLAQQFTLYSGAQVAAFGWTTWLALAMLLLAVFLVAHFPARKAACAEPAESLHEL